MAGRLRSLVIAGLGRARCLSLPTSFCCCCKLGIFPDPFKVSSESTLKNYSEYWSAQRKNLLPRRKALSSSAVGRHAGPAALNGSEARRDNGRMNEWDRLWRGGRPTGRGDPRTSAGWAHRRLRWRSGAQARMKGEYTVELDNAAQRGRQRQHDQVQRPRWLEPRRKGGVMES